MEQILAVSTEFSVTTPRLLTSGEPHFTVLQTPIQTEFTPGSIHSRETGSREASSGEVLLALPSVEGRPGEGTYRGRAQTAEYSIGISTPTNTESCTAKSIASPLTMFYRWPRVYHIPALIIMARHRTSHLYPSYHPNSVHHDWAEPMLYIP